MVPSSLRESVILPLILIESIRVLMRSSTLITLLRLLLKSFVVVLAYTCYNYLFWVDCSCDAGFILEWYWLSCFAVEPWYLLLAIKFSWFSMVLWYLALISAIADNYLEYTFGTYWLSLRLSVNKMTNSLMSLFLFPSPLFKPISFRIRVSSDSLGYFPWKPRNSFRY